MGIEPTSLAWEAKVIAIIRRPPWHASGMTWGRILARFGATPPQLPIAPAGWLPGRTAGPYACLQQRLLPSSKASNSCSTLKSPP